MKKRILVAGGAGFIGSHLCERLLAAGHEVLVVDNLITGNKKNIQHLFDKGLSWIEADIREPLNLNTPCDEIYNLASPASPIDFERIPKIILETACIGHRQLLELAVRWKARILFCSTSEVYGDPLVHPQQEDYFGNVNPVGPRGCYDEAKRFGEALTMAYVRENGITARIARIFNTYGPRMRPEDGRIIPNFFTQALRNEPLTIFGDGKQTRSFCFVEDLARGLNLLMESSESRVVNLGNPIEMTILEMAETVNKIVGNPKGVQLLPARQDDPQKRKPDITRAKSSLNWEPQISLSEGLEKAFEFFKNTSRT